MIYTLTLNPAIDEMIGLDNFELAKTNKAKEQYQILGGKGINVSVMLANLKYKSVAMGFMSSSEESLFVDYLKANNVDSIFHKIFGQTRRNLKIRDFSNNKETELNCLGFNVRDEDSKAILSLIKKNVLKDDVLIISGSIAPGISEDIYQQIAKYCFENKITFAIDARKEALLETLKYQPLLVKPNLAELNEMFDASCSFDNLNEVSKLAQKLLSLGAQNALISNGKYGSLLVTKDCIYLSNVASGILINSVGAGDSMVAGFVGTYLKTHNAKESLLVASASGSATAFSKGIGSLALVEELKKQIKITLIE